MIQAVAAATAVASGTTLAAVLSSAAMWIAILGGVGAVWKLSLMAKAFIERIHAGLTTIEGVSKEFKPNGGSSMKDATNKILVRITDLEGAIAIGIQMDRLLASAPKDAAMFQADHDGALVWVSPRWLEMTGLTLEEASGTGWINAVSAEERVDVEASWMAAKEGHRTWIMDFTVVNVDTSEHFPVHCVSTPAVCKDGRVAGWVGTAFPANLPPLLPVIS